MGDLGEMMRSFWRWALPFLVGVIVFGSIGYLTVRSIDNRNLIDSMHRDDLAQDKQIASLQLALRDANKVLEQEGHGPVSPPTHWTFTDQNGVKYACTLRSQAPSPNESDYDCAAG